MTDPIAPPFPTQDGHARAWEALAHAIARLGDEIRDTPPATPPERPGSLTIIGSGIETLGFTLGDEQLIRDADAVFFCVADPATVTWLKELRPDAYDLYVLYEDGKVRYTTYMQMTEAMLYFVRQGKRVVGIYYGHPGIFVLSTHRAILIARREGHHAVMRPGVCALDCLCADLGVDPCHPGMQTHEATDMLIRGRVPDTSLHVVLWQVGLIGEMGFRRKGYINENFSVFIRYLQKHYGDDYSVTHYMASRFPTVPPTIEVYPLSAMHDPATQARVTGISTFYLAPRDNAVPDVEMLVKLGLLEPGQTPRPAAGPLREIGPYSPRERRAFSAFRHFKVPPGYHWQDRTAASRFLIALRTDHRLAALYRTDPRAALRSRAFADLTERERALLATRDAGAIQVAAKGTLVVSKRNRDFLHALFTERDLLRALVRVLRAATPDTLMERLQAFSAEHGRPADWARMRTDIDLVERDQVFPWIGVYHARQGGRLLVLAGEGARSRLFMDGARITGFSLKRGVLQWAARAGQATHGHLRLDVDRQGRRRLLGSVWPDGEAVPADHRLVLVEREPGRQHASALVGSYRNGEQVLSLEVAESAERGRHLRLSLDGEALPGPVSVHRRRLSSGERSFDLAGVWRKTGEAAASLLGSYTVKGRSGLTSLQLGGGGLLLNGDHAPAVHALDGRNLSWSGGPVGAAEGRVTLLLDPITLRPVLFGRVDGASVVGLVPAPAEVERPEPEFALGPSAWARLVALQARDPWSVGALLWSNWERADLCAQVMNRMLARLLP
ncbi:SAM-dependent methyltransferase [Sorangium sp. So ce1128]